MNDHTDKEAVVQALATTAAASSSTSPWGPLSHKLSEHAGGRPARAIGIQDSTVIDRAIGSPGMLKPHAVHGFVVKLPEKPDRKPAELPDVIDNLRQHIRIGPYISTAVILPYSSDYYPSHVLSIASEVGERIAECYPNAEHALDLVKESADTSATSPSGPWRVIPSSLTTGSDGSVVLELDDPERDARFLAPGDGIVIADPADADVNLGLGRLHHARPGDAGNLLLVLDRYAALTGTQPTNETPELGGA